MADAADRRSRNPILLCAVLAGVAALICVRMPAIVLQGRFWAEEGRDFFHNAWTLPPGQALVATVGGYANLIASGATLVARWMLPLALAPYLTIATGLLFQLCPAVLLLGARDPWLARPWVRGAALLLVVLVPASEEIWLQSLHAQFQLMLCAGIILALDTPAAGAAPFRLALLLLGPLAGPGAIAFLPFYALRALLDRSVARAVQGAALGAGAAIQLACFFVPLPGRIYAPHPGLLLATVAVRHLALPFLGLGPARAIAASFRDAIGHGHAPWLGVTAPLLLLLPLGAALRPRAAEALWLLLAAAVAALTGYLGAIGGGAALIDARFGERYAFVPQALLALALLALAAGSGIPAILARIACAWLLVIGAAEYTRTWDIVAAGPDWRRAVAAWRMGPHRPIPIWPNGWTMDLPEQAARD